MLLSLTFKFAHRAGSLRLPVCLLLALLQRTPVVRMLAAAEFVWAGSSLGQVLKASVVLGSLLGAVDTLVGATPVSPAEETSASAQVGVNFTTNFAVTGSAKSMGSYTVSGLPAGLVVPGSVFSAGTNTCSLNAPFGSITGTPTVAGSFPLIITAAELPNGAGIRQTYNYRIAVSPAANIAPVITTQPVSQTVNAGGAVIFSAAASGTPAPAYQWRKDGADITGATNASYMIAGTTSADDGSYTVVATNSLGAVTSQVATLTVIVAPSNATVAIVVD
jgi:hypothetical protein